MGSPYPVRIELLLDGQSRCCFIAMLYEKRFHLVGVKDKALVLCNQPKPKNGLMQGLGRISMSD